MTAWNREDIPDLKFDPDFTHLKLDKDAGGALADKVGCTCGWQSSAYWDGWEFAMEDFEKHKKGIHVYVVEGEGYDCKCRPDCEETFDTIDIRRHEMAIEHLKAKAKKRG